MAQRLEGLDARKLRPEQYGVGAPVGADVDEAPTPWLSPCLKEMGQFGLLQSENFLEARPNRNVHLVGHGGTSETGHAADDARDHTIRIVASVLRLEPGFRSE
jgi:hypothetical protein